MQQSLPYSLEFLCDSPWKNRRLSQMREKTNFRSFFSFEKTSLCESSTAHLKSSHIYTHTCQNAPAMARTATYNTWLTFKFFQQCFKMEPFQQWLHAVKIKQMAAVTQLNWITDCLWNKIDDTWNQKGNISYFSWLLRCILQRKTLRIDSKLFEKVVELHYFCCPSDWNGLCSKDFTVPFQTENLHCLEITSTSQVTAHRTESPIIAL